MPRPSPLRLQIPHASPSASSANSPNAHTGRPPMWTESAQRKLVRLYLYTMLPVDKIIEVVYMHSTDEPGRDSGNKTLSSLLNKEPRWLRPRNTEEMGRRLKQLAQSSTSSSTSDTRYQQQPRFVAGSGSSGGSNETNTPYFIKSEFTASPGIMDSPVPRFDTHARQYINPAWPSIEPLRRPSRTPHRNNSDEQVFSPFIRRDTILSAASDETNGSYQEALKDYSEPYIKVVKRLVKRYTLSNTQQPDQIHISPSSEPQPPSSIQRWLEDEDCPPRYQSSPFPLPGDFLHLDEYYGSGACQGDTEEHEMRRCVCHVSNDADSSPWVMGAGLTERAMRVLRGSLRPDDMMRRDAANNTVLHFLAARGGFNCLWETINSRRIRPILEERNTAGQTFLHLLPLSRQDTLQQLPKLLRYLHEQDFDIFAKDHYGRNIFHLLFTAEVHPYFIYSVMRPWNHLEARYNTRDAFGNSPMPPDIFFRDPFEENEAEPMERPELPFPLPSPPPNLSLDEDQGLLRSIQHPDPKFEDALGRNALHCLAMCKLSMLSMMEKYHMTEEAIMNARKQVKNEAHPQYPFYQPEDSKTRLELRLRLAQALIEQGVDINHYNYAGHTPLMAFTAELPEGGDYKVGPVILKLLIEHGANIHARNASGETALHVAARCGRKLAMRTLVENGANVHARDSAGRSVLDILNIKIMDSKANDSQMYAHYEACRAWLSGGTGRAEQNPSMMDEWRMR